VVLSTLAIFENVRGWLLYSYVAGTLGNVQWGFGEYLARGGRIGRVQALMGSLLKLKPVINVSHTDGKYSTVTKARTIPAALEALTDNLISIYNKTPVWVNVLHGRFQHGAEMLSEMAEERLNVAKLEISRISPVLGVHTGPGIVGAAVVPMKLMEDLL